MDEKELIATGIGDVPAWLAEEGLELAIEYFENNDLDPQICFEANQGGNDIELAGHWKKAERIANQILTCDSRYDNSMIVLDYDVY